MIDCIHQGEYMTITLSVNGMHCAKCVDKIEKYVGEIDGVNLINVNLQKAEVSIEFNPPATPEKITEAILDAGFDINANNY